MDLDGLIAEFRRRVDDTAKPYLWSSPEVTHYLNEAEREAAERARLLYDESSAFTLLALVADQAEYKLDSRIFDVDQWATLGGLGRIERITRDELDDNEGRRWMEQTGTPSRFFITQRDRGRRYLTVYPIPTKAYTLQISAWRFPKDQMEAGTDEPEIHSRYHMDMIDWAAFLAFSKRDADAEHERLRDYHEARFEARFGIRQDANVQRKQTRRRHIVCRPSW